MNGKNNFTQSPDVTDTQEDSGDVEDSTIILDGGWNRKDNNEDSCKYKTAITISCEATLSGYSKIWHCILK